MPTIRCTGKLQDQMGIKLPTSSEVTAFDWHANLLWLSGKKHVLFCSDVARLSCLTPAVSKSEIADLGGLLKSTLHGVMGGEGFSNEEIQRASAAQDPLVFAKTSNKSVLGTLNDNTMIIRLMLEHNSDEPEFSLSQMPHQLNNMPMKPIGWQYAIEVFKQQVLMIDCARSKAI
jgi:hypothetical protein